MNTQTDERYAAARAIAAEARDVLKDLYNCPASAFFHHPSCGSQWRGPWLIERYHELLRMFGAADYDVLMQLQPRLLREDIGEFAYRCAYFLARMPAMPSKADTKPINMPGGAPDRFPTWLVGATDY